MGLSNITRFQVGFITLGSKSSLFVDSYPLKVSWEIVIYSITDYYILVIFSKDTDQSVGMEKLDLKDSVKETNGAPQTPQTQDVVQVLS